MFLIKQLSVREYYLFFEILKDGNGFIILKNPSHFFILYTVWIKLPRIVVQFTTSNVDETPRETSNYGLVNVCCSHFYLCDVLCDLVPFVQFKKREKHPWRSVTFSKETLLYECFSCFLNYANGTNSRKASHI